MIRTLQEQTLQYLYYSIMHSNTSINYTETLTHMLPHTQNYKLVLDIYDLLPPSPQILDILVQQARVESNEHLVFDVIDRLTDFNEYQSPWISVVTTSQPGIVQTFDFGFDYTQTFQYRQITVNYNHSISLQQIVGGDMSPQVNVTYEPNIDTVNGQSQCMVWYNEEWHLNCETHFDFEQSKVLCQCTVLDEGYISLKTDKNLVPRDRQFIKRSWLSLWLIFLGPSQLLLMLLAMIYDKDDWTFLNKKRAQWQQQLIAQYQQRSAEHSKLIQLRQRRLFYIYTIQPNMLLQVCKLLNPLFYPFNPLQPRYTRVAQFMIQLNMFVLFCYLEYSTIVDICVGVTVLLPYPLAYIWMDQIQLRPFQIVRRCQFCRVLVTITAVLLSLIIFATGTLALMYQQQSDQQQVLISVGLGVAASQLFYFCYGVFQCYVPWLRTAEVKQVLEDFKIVGSILIDEVEMESVN